ncbi:MAG: hypothetical protein C6P37_13170 [Caldibacillus debilis]|uniref:Uncharacterized protein n=1 Tax=Caldibacillus debilis TaxID=301148 RepID=A0A3E0K1J9_9BACI|nr:hypothetical protein [Caldibacillus debilis]REJ26656.1 MAG: hypothetical protein C6P37_13170 [Caldibacillus debilis]
MRWSKLKKQLEDFLCPALKGRVEYWVTNYRKAHDRLGRAYITVDGKEVINMCTLKKEIAVFQMEKALMDLGENFSDMTAGGNGAPELPKEADFPEEAMAEMDDPGRMNEWAHQMAEKQNLFAQYDFFAAAAQFLQTPIRESLKSSHPIIKGMALLDRRVGKRTLLALKDAMEQENDLVKFFYKLRCKAESIQIDEF